MISRCLIYGFFYYINFILGLPICGTFGNLSLTYTCTKVLLALIRKIHKKMYILVLLIDLLFFKFQVGLIIISIIFMTRIFTNLSTLILKGCR